MQTQTLSRVPPEQSADAAENFSSRAPRNNSRRDRALSSNGLCGGLSSVLSAEAGVCPSASASEVRVASPRSGHPHTRLLGAIHHFVLSPSTRQTQKAQQQSTRLSTSIKSDARSPRSASNRSRIQFDGASGSARLAAKPTMASRAKVRAQRTYGDNNAGALDCVRSNSCVGNA